MEQTFELLNDAELELVTGGRGGGISITVNIPNPLAIVGNVVHGALGLVGGVLQGAGGALSALGRLFGGGR